MARQNYRLAAYGVAALFGAALCILYQRAFHVDLVAFWCAGSVFAAHQDPYLDGLLHHCETAAGLIAPLTVPVPYPPYVMPLFALLSLLPLHAALWTWSAVLVGATLATARALERLAGVPVVLSLASCIAVILMPNLEFGQLAPIAICCFAWSLVALREERPSAAAGALSGMAMLPNLAAPAWLAAIVSVRKVRVGLAAATIAFIAIALVCMGVNQCVFYLRQVLPAHAASELATPEQFGLTVLFRALGASGDRAVLLAYAGFISLVAIGILCGLRLKHRYGGDHWVVAAATGIGLFGSPFVHDHDIGFALPLALMLFRETPTIIVRSALILLAVPWLYIFVSPGITDAFLVLPAVVLIVAGIVPKKPLSVATIVLAMAAFFLAVHQSDLPERRMAAVAKVAALTTPAPNALAEIRWKRFNDAVKDPPSIWLARAPIYIGEVLLFAAVLMAASGLISIRSAQSEFRQAG